MVFLPEDASVPRSLSRHRSARQTNPKTDSTGRFADETQRILGQAVRTASRSLHSAYII
jgi:hypothetical protein